MASLELAREGLFASLPTEVLSLIVQARQDLSYLRVTSSLKATEEEIIRYLQAKGHGSEEKTLLFFDHPTVRATMISNVKHAYDISGSVMNKVFFYRERNGNKGITTEMYSPYANEAYQAIFGYHKIFLGLDPLSEYRVFYHQRKLCADYPQVIRQRLVRRYNEEMAPPLEEGELSEKEIRRIIISSILTKRLPYGYFLDSTVVFRHSLDKKGIILAGRAEIDYEANVRAIRDEVIALTGAVPHELDELYLVYNTV